MRIQLESLDDFVAEIESGVYKDTVRVKPVITPVQADAGIFTVAAWYTALDSVAESLIECGVQYGEQSKKDNGKERLDADIAKLEQACKALGINVRPGKLEKY